MTIPSTRTSTRMSITRPPTTLSRSPAVSGMPYLDLHDSHLMHAQLARSRALSQRAADADRQLRMVRALKAARRAERATLRARQLMALAVTR